MDETRTEAESPIVTIGLWSTYKEASERALVVLAFGRPCSVRQVGGDFVIDARAEDQAAIIGELGRYQDDQQSIKPKAPKSRTQPFKQGLPVLTLWILSLMTVFYLQQQDRTLTFRFANSAGEVLRGEWWRPFTALFLHADVGHLLGNVLIGGFFCVLVAQLVGPWRGWLWILSGGTAANAMNAWLHRSQNFRSIGASTATFAALGILVGIASRQAWRNRSYRGFRPLVLPLIAGVVLLGWFGSGGPNTDVAAHVLGMAWGALLAAWSAREPKHGPETYVN